MTRREFISLLGGGGGGVAARGTRAVPGKNVHIGFP
jgi:hypothetical protein